MVQHYVETLARKDHLILNSTSDVFTPTGRTTIHVTWELSVRELGDGRCEFTNHVHSYGTEEFMTFLDRQGIPFEQFRAQRQPVGYQHRAILSQLRISASQHIDFAALAPKISPQAKRLRFVSIDRLILGGVCRLFPKMYGALAIVRPETVIRWHRAGLRSYWRLKSKHRCGRPAVTVEIRQLIRQMSVANPLWGTPRIHSGQPHLNFA